MTFCCDTLRSIHFVWQDDDDAKAGGMEKE